MSPFSVDMNQDPGATMYELSGFCLHSLLENIFVENKISLQHFSFYVFVSIYSILDPRNFKYILISKIIRIVFMTYLFGSSIFVPNF